MNCNVLYTIQNLSIKYEADPCTFQRKSGVLLLDTTDGQPVAGMKNDKVMKLNHAGLIILLMTLIIVAFLSLQVRLLTKSLELFIKMLGHRLNYHSLC